jgi:hypothetical protein
MRTQVFVAFIIAPLTKRHAYRLKGLTLMAAQNTESSVLVGPSSLEKSDANISMIRITIFKE